MDTPYPLPKKQPYTGKQVRDLFRANGLTISAWARSNGYRPYLVYSILCGHTKAIYGKSHKIAIQLGMKLPAENSIAA